MTRGERSTSQSHELGALEKDAVIFIFARECKFLIELALAAGEGIHGNVLFTIGQHEAVTTAVAPLSIARRVAISPFFGLNPKP